MRLWWIIKLRSSDRQIRYEAARKLAILGDRRAVAPLIEALENGDTSIRMGVTWVLGNTGDTSAVGPLIDALKDENWDVRARAREALEKIDPNWAKSESAKKAVPDFIAALKSADSSVRRDMTTILRTLKDPRSIEPLTDSLRDVEASVRNGAEQALWTIDPSWKKAEAAIHAIPHFIAVLKHPDTMVHKGAVDGLNKIDRYWANSEAARESVPEFIISILNAEDLNSRIHAEEALGMIDPNWSKSETARNSLQDFIDALKDEDWITRKRSVKVLLAIGDASAIGPLIGALKDENSEVRKRAKEALEMIDPDWVSSESARYAVPGFITALKDAGSSMRRDMAMVLRAIKDPRAMDALIDALRDADVSVRNSAEQALWAIDPNWNESESALHTFSIMMNDPEYEVRMFATEALGRINNNRAMILLISSLKDEHSAVRISAEESLARIGKPAVELLVDVLNSENSNMKVSAIRALKTIGDNRAVLPLIEVLEDVDWIVQSRAADALGVFGDVCAVAPLLKELQKPVLSYDVRSPLRRILKASVKNVDSKILGEITKLADEVTMHVIEAPKYDWDIHDIHKDVVVAIDDIKGMAHNELRRREL